jgi:hypothetical protein
MNPPAFDQGSGEIDNTIRMDVDRRFGKDGDPTRREAYLAWLRGGVEDVLIPALEQTLALCQQYMGPMRVSRIVGGKREVREVSREDIKGQFDLQLRIIMPGEVEDMGKKLEMIRDAVVPVDSEGLLNRAALVRVMMEYIDPRLAEELVDEEETATQREADDELQKFALLSAGVEPPMKEGVNARLRAQVLQEVIQSNPAVQERAQQDENFRGMLEKRLQHFQFLMQQQENAVIGKIGVKPGQG